MEVVEYQIQSCKCLECGAVVRAEQPQGIVPGQDLSVNLQAPGVWLGNYGHLSYEKLQELLWELGRIEVGVGTLQKTNQRVAAAVEPAINALWKWAPLQSNVHVDETPPVCNGSERMAVDSEWRGILFIPCHGYQGTCGIGNNAGYRICWSLKLR
jgi:transposase